MSLSDDRAALTLTVRWIDEALGKLTAVETDVINAGTVAAHATGDQFTALSSEMGMLASAQDDVTALVGKLNAAKDGIESYIGRMG